MTGVILSIILLGLGVVTVSALVITLIYILVTEAQDE